MQMFVSGIIMKDGQKKACVRFEDGANFAEGYIPECKIVNQEGFMEDEIAQLENYMHENLAELKREAAGVDPIISMIREDGKDANRESN